MRVPTLAVLLLATALTGCLTDRPLTAKPPACWTVEYWHQPGLYEAAGDAMDQPGVDGEDAATRPAGPSLAFEDPHLPLPPDRISLRELYHVVPLGPDDKLVALRLEAKGPGEDAWLTALTWEDDTPDRVEGLARAFLSNVTDADEAQVAAWARQLKTGQRSTDRFPPTRDAVDWASNAESDGYEYNATVAIDDHLALDGLSRHLDESWARNASAWRPWSINVDWSSSNWTADGTRSNIDLRLSTRILATEVNGTRFVVEVGATDKAFVYADRDPGFMPPPEQHNDEGRRWVQAGFEKLGLPAPTIERFSAGGRTC